MAYKSVRDRRLGYDPAFDQVILCAVLNGFKSDGLVVQSADHDNGQVLAHITHVEERLETADATWFHVEEYNIKLFGVELRFGIVDIGSCSEVNAGIVHFAQQCFRRLIGRMCSDE